MSATLEQLRDARELLADPTRWTQGSYARDARGYRALPEAREAACWCALGALLRPALEWDVTLVWGHLLLRRAAKEIFDRTPDWVNDVLGHADVLRMYDRAIELAEAQS